MHSMNCVAQSQRRRYGGPSYTHARGASPQSAIKITAQTMMAERAKLQEALADADSAKDGLTRQLDTSEQTVRETVRALQAGEQAAEAEAHRAQTELQLARAETQRVQKELKAVYVAADAAADRAQQDLLVAQAEAQHGQRELQVLQAEARARKAELHGLAEAPPPHPTPSTTPTPSPSCTRTRMRAHRTYAPYTTPTQRRCSELLPATHRSNPRLRVW